MCKVVWPVHAACLQYNCYSLVDLNEDEEATFYKCLVMFVAFPQIPKRCKEFAVVLSECFYTH